MKVIIINNLYPPWVHGGAEVIAERSAEGLRKLGHEVFVIATAPVESQTDQVHYLPSIFYNLEKYSLADRFFWHLADIFNFSHAGKIKKILAEKKPDLVITHNLQGIGYLLPRLLRQRKIRHFHTLHDIQLLHPSGLLIWGKEKLIEAWPAKTYQAIMRALLGSPELVISPSRWLLDLHLRRGFFRESSAKVLPNYFKEQNFTKRPESQISNFKSQFLFVGQIEKHKGVASLVEAFLNFLEKHPAAGLAIAGGGSQLEEIKKMAGGRPEIKILGRKNQGEVEELMRGADCLVVPSLCYENSPTVIYEAIAAGLPVIASRIGGITELVEASGGILFEPGNVFDLAEKMADLAADPGARAAIEAKQKSWSVPDYLGELARLAKG